MNIINLVKTYDVLVECTTNGSRGVFRYTATSAESAMRQAALDLASTVYKPIEVILN